MKYLLSVLLLLASATVNAQTLYSRAFGNNKSNPIIFLHGGPGSSSVYFEATTAQKLADKGFYVIIYDRRGEGRSIDRHAKMNFAEAFEDLNSIYKKYGLTKVNLIGFSFGGLITAQFAAKYPDKVKTVVLVSALVSQQQSYNTILKNVKAIYLQQKDSIKLQDIARIEKLDTNSLAYRTDCFKHATSNGYFTLKNPDTEAKTIYATYSTNTLITKYVKNEDAVATFWKNEKLKNIDTTPQLKYLLHKKIKLYALYGKQDGLYSIKQISDIEKLTGKENLRYLDNCSHTVFIDQQVQFITTLQHWLN